MVSTGRRYKTVYQTQSSPTNHRGSMKPQWGRSKCKKSIALGHFPHCCMILELHFLPWKVLAQKLQNVSRKMWGFTSVQGLFIWYEWRCQWLIVGGTVAIFNHVCARSMVMETPTDRTHAMRKLVSGSLLMAVTSLWHSTLVSNSCRMCINCTCMRTGIWSIQFSLLSYGRLSCSLDLGLFGFADLTQTHNWIPLGFVG